MNNNSSSSTAWNILLGLFALAFVVLKLCNVITWSWWWVLAPLWVPTALALVIIVICLFVWIITHK